MQNNENQWHAINKLNKLNVKNARFKYACFRCPFEN
jgi:hypothetical protein